MMTIVFTMIKKLAEYQIQDNLTNRRVRTHRMRDGDTQLVWFKRDLRIEDNTVLTQAAEKGPVLPLYIVEPEYWLGPDTSARQWNFIRDCLIELRTTFDQLGVPLIVRCGNAIEILSQILQSNKFRNLWSHEETGNAWTFNRDKNVAGWCKIRGIEWTELPQNGVIRGPSNRDKWAAERKKFASRKQCSLPNLNKNVSKLPLGSIPKSKDLKIEYDDCVFRQKGGRSEGLKTLESFIFKRGLNYRVDMSSPISAQKSCSRISPHLAYGSLSIREVSQATQKQKNTILEGKVENSSSWGRSLSSFNSRLYWHCHFIQKLEDEVELEWKNLHSAYDGIRGDNKHYFQSWSKGETGWPFVDACMRMLRATGWINFRMRAMLASIASYHLWMDWRKPGEQLARLFTDYEPGIHWSQIQMQSGTTGINLPRVYNPVKQGKEQDPAGFFVRHWLPELAVVPDEYIHEPWDWGDATQFLKDTYPHPIVDHLKVARIAREKVWAIRGSDSHKEIALKIQDKHGSRKKRFKKSNYERLSNNKKKLEQPAKEVQLGLFDRNGI